MSRIPLRVWLAAAVVVACLAGVGVWLVVTRGGPPSYVATGPLNGRLDATFDIVSGAEVVHVRSADLGQLAYRVVTPNGGSLRPEVTDSGDRVALTLVPSGAPGTASVEILLSVAVRWHVRSVGGGAEEVVDFRTGRLSGVELLGGAARVEVSVPEPQGTLPIRLAGGAGALTVRAPAGPPARVLLGAGAGEVTVDGKAHGSLAAGSTVTPPEWAAATDRFEIEAAGGVSRLTLERG